MAHGSDNFDYPKKKGLRDSFNYPGKKQAVRDSSNYPYPVRRQGFRDSSNYPGRKLVRDSSNYPGRASGTFRRGNTSENVSDEYPKKTTQTSKRSVLSGREVIRNIRTILMIVVFIEVLIIIGIVSSFYAMAINKAVTPVIVWPLEMTPGVGKFEEFAISSSSEICSEFARTMYMEGFKGNLIAAAMQFCLALQQPDRSGELGSSVAVHYSSMTGCRYTKGQSLLSHNRILLDNTAKAVEGNAQFEFRGPYSELLPLDILTTLAFLENATRKDLEDIAVLMTMEHGRKIIAQTIHAVNPLELEGPLIRSDLLFDEGEELSRRQMGDLIEVSDFDKRMKHFVSILDLKDAKKLQSYLRSQFSYDNLEYGDPISSDFSIIDNVTQYWQRNNLEISTGTRSYCYPGHPSVAEHVMKAVQDTSVPTISQVPYSFPPDIAMSFLNKIFDKFYEKMWRDSRNPSFTVKKESNKKELGSNMFAMAIGEEAYSYVGTLGTSFGSLSTKPFMNNLLHNIPSTFMESKGYTNSMHPFIVVQDGKVLVVYAPPPGLPSQSLGIPRLVNSLLLTAVFNYSLENAVLYPLLYYSDRRKKKLLRHEYPFQSKYGKDIIKGGTLVENIYESAPDSVAAISRRRDQNNRTVFVAFYKNRKKKIMNRPQYNTRVIGV